MKFLSNSLKVTLLLLSLFIFNGCSDDDKDGTSGDIVGIWQLGKIYGSFNYTGTNADLDGESEGTMEFKSDGTYESNIIGGTLTITIPTINYSDTTPIDPSLTSGDYFYNQSTDDLEIDGEMSKVVVLNNNFVIKF